ncbi:MAG: YdeI/OmpD-associated family protein [Rhodospirillaceae bacterium]|nr:YdeI/OmpD-associated family protein [Rhodospirillaceae bacterium]
MSPNRPRPAAALAKVDVESVEQWRAWLQAHHRQRQSVWAVTYKKGSNGPYVSAAEIAEQALCFGWIDSLPRKLDSQRTMLLISPRRTGSAWSKLNKDRVARMIAAGQMTPAGLAKIEAAQRDGSWSKLDGVDALAMPDDLALALAALPKARDNFQAFPPSARRGILEWIVQARRPATRARRVAETARLAARNIRANQYRPK